MALFESYERRIDKINGVLAEYGISSIEEAEKITKDADLFRKRLLGIHSRGCYRHQEGLPESSRCSSGNWRGPSGILYSWFCSRHP